MSASETSGFTTAKRMRDGERGIAPSSYRYEAEDPAIAASLVVRPELSIEEAAKVWNAFLELRDTILSDPACYDEIDGKKDMNRDTRFEGGTLRRWDRVVSTLGDQREGRRPVASRTSRPHEGRDALRQEGHIGSPRRERGRLR